MICSSPEKFQPELSAVTGSLGRAHLTCVAIVCGGGDVPVDVVCLFCWDDTDFGSFPGPGAAAFFGEVTDDVIICDTSVAASLVLDS